MNWWCLINFPALGDVKFHNPQVIFIRIPPFRSWEVGHLSLKKEREKSRSVPFMQPKATYRDLIVAIEIHDIISHKNPYFKIQTQPYEKPFFYPSVARFLNLFLRVLNCFRINFNNWIILREMKFWIFQNNIAN